MSQRRINVGKKGEQAAVKYLLDKGFTILERNYRTRRGELDIIACHDETLVFVEVKSRSTPFLDNALEAVTLNKIKQINLVAQEYLSANNLFHRDARFDVIGIEFKNSGDPQIDHIENGFDGIF